MLHHMAKAFYAPVVVVAMPGPEGIALVGVNDRLDPVELSVTAYATALDGTAREIGRASASVGEASERLLLIPPGTLGEQEVLTFGWEGSDGTHAGDVFAPKPWKAYDLPDPGLAHRVDAEDGPPRPRRHRRADGLLRHRRGRRARPLGPRRAPSRARPRAALTFTPRDAGAAPTFTLRDLWSATTRA